MAAHVNCHCRDLCQHNAKRKLYSDIAKHERHMLCGVTVEDAEPILNQHCPAFCHKPLKYAVIKGNVDTVRQLLEAGADPNAFRHHLCRRRPLACAHHTTPLEFAVIYANVPCVKLLLQYGADPNLAVTARFIASPLPRAIFLLNTCITKELLLANARRISIEVHFSAGRLPSKPSDRLYVQINELGHTYACVFTRAGQEYLMAVKSTSLINMVNLLILLGCPIAVKGIPRRVYNNHKVNTFVSSIMHRISMPFNLQQCCRKVINSCMPSVKYREQVRTLPLPMPVKDYVSYQQVVNSC